MRVQFYCDLYVSECWKSKKKKIMRKLQNNKLDPMTYVVALAQGERNNLEIFSGLFLGQNIFRHAEIFVVGIADGYVDALRMVEHLTKNVFDKTGDAGIRHYITLRQDEYDRTGR